MHNFTVGEELTYHRMDQSVKVAGTEGCLNKYTC